MKNIFGELELSWKKVIISAIIIGVVIGLLNSVPFLIDSSFRDPAIYFSLWILFGIIIIMNSKSNLDAALKCFVFFLISQPLIYLVEVPFNRMGWGIFVYYKPWFEWTLLTFPMGLLGYFMKKDKWWGLVFLLPMMCLLGYELSGYFSGLIYSFPHHLLSVVFCIICLLFFPLFIFKNKPARIIGTIVGIVLIAVAIALPFVDKPVYETEPICANEEHPFDDTYKVSLGNSEYGEIDIVKHESELEDGTKEAFYCVHAKFTKTGKTDITLESPTGEKRIFDIDIKKNTYDIEERKDQE